MFGSLAMSDGVENPCEYRRTFRIDVLWAFWLFSSILETQTHKIIHRSTFKKSVPLFGNVHECLGHWRCRTVLKIRASTVEPSELMSSVVSGCFLQFLKPKLIIKFIVAHSKNPYHSLVMFTNFWVFGDVGRCWKSVRVQSNLPNWCLIAFLAVFFNSWNPNA